MTSSGELIRIALLALLTGVAVPLLVQLFLTLRSLRLATDAVERRLDKLQGDVNAIADEVRTRASNPGPLAASLTAAVPAILAGVQAFRASMHGDAATAGDHDGEPRSSKQHDTKERSHEQRKV